MALFKDRLSAAALLAKALSAYRGKRALVLGLPRGGVPMAELVARELGAELDIVLCHKLRAPNQAELAIGAVSEVGDVEVNENARCYSDPGYVHEETKFQLEALRRRRRLYTPKKRPTDPRNRTVIVVDDGFATGATVMAALNMLRRQGAGKLIVAAAVSPPGTASGLAQLADEVVVLETPENFEAVGQFFEDFSEVTDEEVVRCLGRAFARGEAAAQGGGKP